MHGYVWLVCAVLHLAMTQLLDEIMIMLFLELIRDYDHRSSALVNCAIIKRVSRESRPSLAAAFPERQSRIRLLALQNVLHNIIARD